MKGSGSRSRFDPWSRSVLKTAATVYEKDNCCAGTKTIHWMGLLFTQNWERWFWHNFCNGAKLCRADLASRASNIGQVLCNNLVQCVQERGLESTNTLANFEKRGLGFSSTNPRGYINRLARCWTNLLQVCAVAVGTTSKLTLVMVLFSVRGVFCFIAATLQIIMVIRFNFLQICFVLCKNSGKALEHLVP